jgi:hypothetical protein
MARAHAKRATTLLVSLAFAGLLVMAAALNARAQTRSPSTAASPGAGIPTTNPPWYPSLEAFEHYNSGRSHVFSMARFDASFHRPNRVAVVSSDRGAYPSGYNMSYLNAKDAFIQGGSYGDVTGSIGPFVAKLDPETLKPVWYTQLVNTVQTGEWDYPGAMAIMSDGFIYVVSGYRIFKVNPVNGKVVQTLKLPTMVYMRSNYPNMPPTYDTTLTEDAVNTSYNGINALPDGTIVVKSLYRVAGCTLNGPSALLKCPNAQDVPASNLISVDPKTMRIIDNITLPAFAGARPTITRYHGIDYVYLLEKTSNVVRYSVHHGFFHLDTRWTPVPVPYPDQTTGGSVIVMSNWIVGATNTIPAAGPLTVFAINQSDARKQFFLQPYVNDPIPPLLSHAFATAAAGGAPAVSWADMSLEADPQNGLFYGVETLARKVAAFRVTDSGIATVWKQSQTTTEWATLIGPKHHRVWVGTDIPGAEIPGANRTESVVWRDAATGRKLARSPRVPQMTQGSAVQPGYGGSMFFPAAKGTLIKLTPHAASRVRISRLHAAPLRQGCAVETGSAELEITAISADATCRHLRLEVDGTIEAGRKLQRSAAGTVRVSFAVELPSGRATGAAQSKVSGGHWRVSLVLPGVNLDPLPPLYLLTARYSGDRTTAPATAKRRIRLESELAGLNP